MRYVIDDGAAIAFRGARIAARRYVERDRKAGFFDQRPHPIEDRQIVIVVIDVVRTPDRFTRQGEASEAEGGDTFDFLYRTVQIARCDGRQRRYRIVVVPKLFPSPFVPHLALRHGEDRVGRRPHGKTFVREHDLAIDAVIAVVFETTFDGRTCFTAHTVFAEHLEIEDFRRPVAFRNAPFAAFIVGLDAGNSVEVLFVDPFLPKVERFICVRVG